MSDETDSISVEYLATQESLQALQDQIKNSYIPSNGDGITNSWRTMFVCEVFEVEDVDLNQTFPYSALMACKDPDKVRASIHLAKLQFQFNESCRHLEYLDNDQADYFACFLHHMIRLMTHHLKFVELGKPTPPIGFN